VKRWALPIAIAALLALAALVLVELLRSPAAPTQAEQAQQIAGDLRCPDCQALSVAESQTAAAAAIRRQIVEQLAAGKTAEQVRAYFVARYGEWILLAPTSPFAWWIPAAAVLVGIGVLAWWWRRGRATLAPLTPPVPGRGAREQIREEVEQLDA
jgi:cytochrome c-type biogenesis protein CcmH